MYNIYDRVRELVADKESKLTDKAVFTSREYESFMAREARTCIGGTCYTLRRKGFNVSKEEESQVLNHLIVHVVWEKEEETAFTTETNGCTYVELNANSSLISHYTSRLDKHHALLGFLYHELAHVLFTNFPVMRAWYNALARGVWWPEKPKGINTAAGIELTNCLGEETWRGIFTQVAQYLWNALEDGFVEREITELYPGDASYYLAVTNDAMLDEASSLEEDIQHKEKSRFSQLFPQLLQYAKYSENKIGECDDEELLSYLYDCLDDIDDFRRERDATLRMKGINDVIIKIAPLIREEVERLQKEMPPKPPQNGSSGDSSGGQGTSGQGTSGQGTSGQGASGQGTSGQGAAGGQGSADGQSGGAPQIKPLPQEVLDAVLDMLDKAAKKNGATSQNSTCTSGSMTDPTKAPNRLAATQQSSSTSGQSGGAENNAAGTSKGPGGMRGSVNKRAGENDLNRIMQEIAQNAANKQAEKERTAEYNQDANQTDCGELRARPIYKIQRAEAVSDTNIESFNKVAPEFVAISRDLRRGVERLLADQQNGDVLKNLPFGRRIEVNSAIRGDGKVFSRKRLPTRKRTLSVALLVDESGSTNGPLIKASICTAIVIEDFCRNMRVPHYICGYTSAGGADANIFLYATPDEIDNGNRYRLTGMQARGGTPTAAALCYARDLLRRLDTDVKLLFVISDGGAGDNRGSSFPYTCHFGDADDDRPITKILTKAHRDNMIVIACGIGSQRKLVEAEFGEENFLNISNLNELPERIIRIIKANLYL